LVLIGEALTRSGCCARICFFEDKRISGEFAESRIFVLKIIYVFQIKLDLYYIVKKRVFLDVKIRIKIVK
jgi:hypothetical protein